MGYTTEWGYNAADMPTWMKYPDNETVNYTYNPRLMLNSVIGTSTYVSSTTYDSAGRIDLRTFGNNTQTDYVYYPWTAQGGRLQYLKSGTSGNPVSLQNLSYEYDDVGNIENITNTLASETNTYTYDTLNRLTSWTLNGGAPETYSYDASGNLDVKASVDLNYNDSAHVHAVTHIGSTQKYWYDANGSQTTRIIGADTYNLLYDAENRLLEVKKNNVSIATFVYDGDGRRVKSTVNGTTTLFIGAHYELTGSTVTKYYFAGAQRIAMRKYTIPQSMSVEYLLGDHLGSTSITTDANGAKVSEMRYKPWGEIRYSWTAGLSTTPAYKLTDYTYTGQYSHTADFGLMFYKARWYDPALGRFAQADSIVPNNIQGLDRFAYVFNNPLVYVDPSGHCGVKEGKFDGKFDCTADDINKATMKQRLAWFRGFLAATEREEWFANIDGILQAFIDDGLGDTNSWISWVDAGILVSIQNGWALFKDDQTSENAADMAWRDFFAATDEDDMKQKWGAAENLGTQYGLALADEHGAVINEREQLFLNLGNKLYRDLISSGQIEEFYGQLAADVGALYCDPGYHDFCGGWVDVFQSVGAKIGGWFGDPRSKDPIFHQAPVYYLARLILE